MEAEEDVVQGMEPDAFKAWGKRFSLDHGGRFWNSPPLLPFKYVWADPLHLFLNLFNVAFDESIDFYCQHEFVIAQNKALIGQCDSIAGEINTVLARAHITARFGTAERKAFCGNDLRAQMEDPDVLPTILACIRPLYARMEPMSFAGDALKAREEKAKAEERASKPAAAGGGKAKGRRVDADDFDSTAGISREAAKRARKQQAELQAAVDKSRTFEERFEAHVHAMEQTVDGNYSWCVVNMLNALVEFYEFVHAKQWLADALAADALAAASVVVGKWSLGRGPHVTAAVQTRRTECKVRSMALAKDAIKTVGEAREQTYLHDLVYGLHRVFDVVLHLLLAGMQGCEHVNKQMKLSLVSQCPAANNNRLHTDGTRMQSDVAQAAVAKVMRTHIAEVRSSSLPQNLYGQALMGNVGWGSKVSKERKAKRDSKGFTVGSVPGLQALRAGVYSPQAHGVTSPATMEERLKNPPRKKRFAVPGPSLLRPDFMEPEPECVRY
jgi:hypothetical protein